MDDKIRDALVQDSLRVIEELERRIEQVEKETYHPLDIELLKNTLKKEQEILEDMKIDMKMPNNKDPGMFRGQRFWDMVTDPEYNFFKYKCCSQYRAFLENEKDSLKLGEILDQKHEVVPFESASFSGVAEF